MKRIFWVLCFLLLYLSTGAKVVKAQSGQTSFTCPLSNPCLVVPLQCGSTCTDPKPNPPRRAWTQPFFDTENGLPGNGKAWMDWGDNYGQITFSSGYWWRTFNATTSSVIGTSGWIPETNCGEHASGNPTSGTAATIQYDVAGTLAIGTSITPTSTSVNLPDMSKMVPIGNFDQTGTIACQFSFGGCVDIPLVWIDDELIEYCGMSATTGPGTLYFGQYTGTPCNSGPGNVNGRGMFGTTAASHSAIVYSTPSPTAQPNVWGACPAPQGAAIANAVSITNVQVASNFAIFQASNSYVAGQKIYIYGLTGASFLNTEQTGAVQTVSATGLTSSQFEVPFTHPNYPATADAGFANQMVRVPYTKTDAHPWKMQWGDKTSSPNGCLRLWKKGKPENGIPNWNFFYEPCSGASVEVPGMPGSQVINGQTVPVNNGQVDGIVYVDPVDNMALSWGGGLPYNPNPYPGGVTESNATWVACFSETASVATLNGLGCTSTQGVFAAQWQTTNVVCGTSTCTITALNNLKTGSTRQVQFTGMTNTFLNAPAGPFTVTTANTAKFTISISGHNGINSPDSGTALLASGGCFANGTCSQLYVWNRVVGCVTTSVTSGVATCPTTGQVFTTQVTAGHAGTGYATGNTGNITGGGGTGATYTVLTQTGGAVTSFSITPGSGYSITPGASTAATTGSGTGLEIDINYVTTAFMLSCSGNRWVQTTTPCYNDPNFGPEPRHAHNAYWDPDNSIFVMYGGQAFSSPEACPATGLNTTGLSGDDTSLATFPYANAGSSGATAWTATNCPSIPNTVWIYSPTSRRWTFLTESGDIPAGHQRPAMDYDTTINKGVFWFGPTTAATQVGEYDHGLYTLTVACAPNCATPTSGTAVWHMIPASVMSSLPFNQFTNNSVQQIGTAWNQQYIPVATGPGSGTQCPTGTLGCTPGQPIDVCHNAVYVPPSTGVSLYNSCDGGYETLLYDPNDQQHIYVDAYGGAPGSPKSSPCGACPSVFQLPSAFLSSGNLTTIPLTAMAEEGWLGDTPPGATGRTNPIIKGTIALPESLAVPCTLTANGNRPPSTVAPGILQIQDDTGAILPSQFRCTAWWPNSHNAQWIKYYTQVGSFSDTAGLANDNLNLAVVATGGGNHAPSGGSSSMVQQCGGAGSPDAFCQNSNQYLVRTLGSSCSANPSVCFLISVHNYDVFDAVEVNGVNLVCNGAPPCRLPSPMTDGILLMGPTFGSAQANTVCRANGLPSINACNVVYSSLNDSTSTLTIEENGPLVAEFEIQGSLEDALGDKYTHFTTRMEFQWGQSFVKVTDIPQNADSPLTATGADFPSAGKQYASRQYLYQDALTGTTRNVTFGNMAGAAVPSTSTSLSTITSQTVYEYIGFSPYLEWSDEKAVQNCTPPLSSNFCFDSPIPRGKQTNVTNVSVASSIATITSNNIYNSGEPVFLSGFTNATFLNGLTLNTCPNSNCPSTPAPIGTQFEVFISSGNCTAPCSGGTYSSASEPVGAYSFSTSALAYTQNGYELVGPSGTEIAPAGYNDIAAWPSFTITKIAQTGNTVTATAANTLVAGQSVILGFLDQATFLNNAVVTVATANSTSFTFNWPVSQTYPATNDNGNAFLNYRPEAWMTTDDNGTTGGIEVGMFQAATFWPKGMEVTTTGGGGNFGPATVNLSDCLPATVVNAATTPPISTAGGVINLPSCGTSGSPIAWTNPNQNTPAVHITVNVPIELHGNTTCNGTPTTPTTACTDHTFIGLNGQAALDATGMSNANFLRVTGITFIDNSTQAWSNGIIQLHGCSHGQQAFRVDNIHLEGNSGSGGIKESDCYGLNDHILAEDTGTNGLRPVFIPHGDGGTSGFQNWEDATNLGSFEAIYVENSSYNSQSGVSGSSEGFFDCYEGAKIVIRYNIVNNSRGGGCHGTDSGNLWSPVYQEIYNNTETNTYSSGTLIPMPQWRGGTGVVFNNIFTGTQPFGSFVLQYQRVQLPSNVGQWGDVFTGLNWIPSSTDPTQRSSTAPSTTVYSLNGNGATPAHDWAANTVYHPNDVIAPTGASNTTAPGAKNSFFQMQGGSNCTSANVAQSTITWNQTGGATNSDGAGGCTWTNVQGDIRATGVARAGFCAAHPDTFSASDAACAAVVPGDTASRYFDCTAGVTNCSAGYPLRDQPGVGHDQVSYPLYEWSNSGSQIHTQPLFSGAPSVQANRDYFDYNSSFNGTTGVGTGTKVPTDPTAYSGAPNCTTGVGYAVVVNPQIPLLYRCVATNTWALYYTPAAFPHPLAASPTSAVVAADVWPNQNNVIAPTNCPALCGRPYVLNWPYYQIHDIYYNFYAGAPISTQVASDSFLQFEHPIEANPSWSYWNTANDATSGTNALLFPLIDPVAEDLQRGTMGLSSGTSVCLPQANGLPDGQCLQDMQSVSGSSTQQLFLFSPRYYSWTNGGLTNQNDMATDYLRNCLQRWPTTSSLAGSVPARCYFSEIFWTRFLISGTIGGRADGFDWRDPSHCSTSPVKCLWVDINGFPNATSWNTLQKDFGDQGNQGDHDHFSGVILAGFKTGDQTIFDALLTGGGFMQIASNQTIGNNNPFSCAASSPQRPCWPVARAIGWEEDFHAHYAWLLSRVGYTSDSNATCPLGTPSSPVAAALCGSDLAMAWAVAPQLYSGGWPVGYSDATGGSPYASCPTPGSPCPPDTGGAANSIGTSPTRGPELATGGPVNSVDDCKAFTVGTPVDQCQLPTNSSQRVVFKGYQQALLARGLITMNLITDDAGITGRGPQWTKTFTGVNSGAQTNLTVTIGDWLMKQWAYGEGHFATNEEFTLSGTLNSGTQPTCATNCTNSGGRYEIYERYFNSEPFVAGSGPGGCSLNSANCDPLCPTGFCNGTTWEANWAAQAFVTGAMSDFQQSFAYFQQSFEYQKQKTVPANTGDLPEEFGLMEQFVIGMINQNPTPSIYGLGSGQTLLQTVPGGVSCTTHGTGTAACSVGTAGPKCVGSSSITSGDYCDLNWTPPAGLMTYLQEQGTLNYYSCVTTGIFADCNGGNGKTIVDDLGFVDYLTVPGTSGYPTTSPIAGGVNNCVVNAPVDPNSNRITGCYQKDPASNWPFMSTMPLPDGGSNTTALNIASGDYHFVPKAGTVNTFALKAYFPFSPVASVTLTATNSSICTGNSFASSAVGVASADSPCPLTLMNNTGAGITGLSAPVISGAQAADFTDSSPATTCGSSLANGASCSVSVTFTPSGTGIRNGSIGFTWTGPTSGSVNYALSGTGTTSGSVTLTGISFSPPSYVDGTSSPAVAAVLSNSSGTLATLGTITITGTNAADFALSTGTGACSSTLATGTTCNVYVIFTPSIVGAELATLNVPYTGPVGSPVTSNLTGTGIAAGTVTIAPTFPLVCNGNPFDNTINGQTSGDSPCSFTITNNSPSSINSIVPSIPTSLNSADFSAGNSTCTFTLPNTPGSNTCIVTASFNPLSGDIGFLTASLSVSYVGTSGSPLTVTLTGNSINPLILPNYGPFFALRLPEENQQGEKR